MSVFCNCYFTSCFLATSVQGLFGSWQINTNLFESKLYGCCWPVDLLETSQKYAFLGMRNTSNKTRILKVSSFLQRMLFRQFVKNSRSVANFRFLCKEKLKFAEISKWLPYSYPKIQNIYPEKRLANIGKLAVFFQTSKT